MIIFDFGALSGFGVTSPEMQSALGPIIEKVANTRDFDLVWDFDKPAETERAFRRMLEKAPDKEYRLELLTQIARCQGLQREFGEAHSTLDEVESEMGGGRVRVRYLLERGRVFNSSGEKDKARPLFQEAFDLAMALDEEFFAVDAAHMMAIVSTPHSALEWNLKALDIAEKALDDRARNWRGSLRNNLGWTYHEQGRYPEALQMFEKPLEARVLQGKRNDILVARWCIGRCLRSMGKADQALEIQRELLAAREMNQDPDGFVHEEIGELLLDMGEGDEAKEHFRRAHEQLSTDAWLAANEATRLERLQRLGGA